MDPNDQRFSGLSLKEFEKRRVGDRLHFLDGTGVERRTGPVMMRHLDLYQAVRNFSRVFAKVSGAPIRGRPCLPVGDVADCLVEISGDAKRPDSSVQKFCQKDTEVRRNREVKSCKQSKYVTQRRKKHDDSSSLSHEFDFNSWPPSCVAGSRARTPVRFTRPAVGTYQVRRRLLPLILSRAWVFPGTRNRLFRPLISSRRRTGALFSR